MKNISGNRTKNTERKSKITETYTRRSLFPEIQLSISYKGDDESPAIKEGFDE
jgi:hypothetical protein